MANLLICYTSLLEHIYFSLVKLTSYEINYNIVNSKLVVGFKVRKIYKFPKCALFASMNLIFLFQVLKH